ncbi:DUF4302 domain-containing protein [Chitinophaga rhizosphaerae]|uniref:DUF4302 domain-containing protein n=1 Tax=Chitinophaga rhizosphaerae TaxID=1864947 RepID=UPI000F8049F2|nr:DUF4302 domain-containing protein [Chitinophaga rhizosphaerae]
MMRIFSCIILAAVTLAACRKEPDPIFSETADQRINRVLNEYQTVLAASANGWNGEMTTRNNVTYRFHFSFDNANHVKMFSDFDGTSSSVRKESSFRLKALQQPSLLFDSYSYIHILADPADSISGGPEGVGLNGDFEFSMDSVTADVIKLTGRQQGAKMTLRKASAADLDAWQTGKWAGGARIADISKKILNYFKRLTIGGRQYEIRIDPSFHTITFTWRDGGGNPQSHTTDYNYSADGLILTEPLQDGPNSISRLSGMTWNGTTLNLNVNGATAGAISGAIAPLVIDLNAGIRWYQASQQTYWRGTSFNIKGVWDTYGLWKLENFAFLIFQYGSQYDIFGFVFLESGGLALNFGLGTDTPDFTGGKTVFTALGELGDVPPEAMDAYVKTAVKFLNPDGWWFIQTGPHQFDMVDATDATSYMVWY